VTAFSQRARHIVFIVAGLITFIALAGVTYQSVATALERRKFPYPGRLIAVGDHQLHLHCVGKGAPTVVLEGPAAGMSMGWWWVQDDVAKTTRVCSYDRAGLGWSEAGDGGYRAARVPDELHTLLERAGERGPFVIVGHELGASFARMYASRFRDQTAALVAHWISTSSCSGKNCIATTGSPAFSVTIGCNLAASRMTTSNAAFAVPMNRPSELKLMHVTLP